MPDNDAASEIPEMADNSQHLPGASAVQLMDAEPTQVGIAQLWVSEVWPTLKLAAPIMAARAGVTLMFVVDAIMIGQAHGADLAFFGQGLAPQSVMMLLSIGLLQGSMVISAQAYGAKDYLECGRIWRIALMFAALLGGALGALSLFVEDFLNLIGTEEPIARGAGAVSLQFAWGMQGMLLYIASNYLLETIKRPMFGMLIMAACNALNLVADGILVAGWFGWVDGWGAPGAVMTTSAVRWLAFALALIAVLRLIDGERFGVWAPLGAIRPRIVRMLRIGGPIAFMLGLDQAAFSTVVLMAGHMGEATAAAHQLTVSLSAIFFMSVVGLSAATAIRVGHAVGAGDADEAAKAGWTGIGVSLAITLTVAAVFLLLPRTLASIYTSDALVLDIAQWAIMASAAMIVADGTVTVTFGALRGRGDTSWPALIHAGSLWCIGVPAAYALGFLVDWGPVGLFLGLAAGVCLSWTILTRRFAQLAGRPVVRA
jgi:MATE family multidrug resistance protein